MNINDNMPYLFRNNLPRVLGVILARGGSKSVLKKNIRPICGIPLIAYTIAEARKSTYLTRLIVSSDDYDIRRVAIQYGAEAPFERPHELASDTARAVDCDKHALMWAEQDEGRTYDYVVELMCTNPMKTVWDIDSVIDKLITTKADSVIGVSKLDDHHPIRIKKIVDDHIVDFCLPEIPETHRQQLKPEAYIRNGSIYGMKREMLLRGVRYGSKNSRPYIMPAERSVNIDNEIDLILAEILLKKHSKDHIRPLISEEHAEKAISGSE